MRFISSSFFWIEGRIYSLKNCIFSLYDYDGSALGPESPTESFAKYNYTTSLFWPRPRARQLETETLNFTILVESIMDIIIYMVVLKRICDS